MNRLRQTGRMLKLTGGVMRRNPHLFLFFAGSIFSVFALFAAAIYPVAGGLARRHFAAEDESHRKSRLEALAREKKEILGERLKLENTKVETVRRVSETRIVPKDRSKPSYTVRKEIAEDPRDSERRMLQWRLERVEGDAARAAQPIPEIKIHWPTVIAAGALVYFPCAFLLFFFQAAFLVSVRNILNGRPSSLVDGLKTAWTRRADIAAWALFSSSVLILLQIVQSKVDRPWLRWLIGGLGVGWQAATFLVFPVLALEGGNPKRVLERSSALFKKTWGENLAGHFGLGLIEGAAAVLFCLGSALIGFAYMQRVMDDPIGSFTADTWIASPLFQTAALGAAVFVVIFLCKMAEGIFETVLYLYATEGVVPEEYRGEDEGWFVAARGR